MSGPVFARISILPLTAIATAPILERQLVGFDGAPAGLDADVLGVADLDAGAGQPVTVGACGTYDVVAGGAIAVGDAVSSDAQARAVSGGTNPFGKALTAAAGAGARVKVLIR